MKPKTFIMKKKTEIFFRMLPTKSFVENSCATMEVLRWKYSKSATMEKCQKKDCFCALVWKEYMPSLH